MWWPPELLLLLAALGNGLVINKKRPYTEMITPVMEYCYRELVSDSTCCLDTSMPSGMRLMTLDRPEAQWNCSETCCLSMLRGRRGSDLVWLPPVADCESPRILYVHGGAWTYGSPYTSGYAEFGAKLANITGAMVMVIDYPLVSGGNSTGDFNTIMSSAISAMQWLAENGPEPNCSEAAPLFIGGDSSGGTSALSLAIRLANEPQLLSRPLTGVFLFSPWTNLACNSPEYYHNAYAHIDEGSGFYRSGIYRQLLAKARTLTAFKGDIVFRLPPNRNSEDFLVTANNYVQFEKELLTDPVASPYYAPPELLSRLPPLYITVGGAETILGDSIVVAQNAALAGVPVHLDIHPGMWHVFPMYADGCGSGQPLWNGLRALNNTALFVRHLSETGKPPYTVGVQQPSGGGGIGAGSQPYTTMSYDPVVPCLIESDEEVDRILNLLKAKEMHKRVLKKQKS